MVYNLLGLMQIPPAAEPLLKRKQARQVCDVAVFGFRPSDTAVIFPCNLSRNSVTS